MQTACNACSLRLSRVFFANNATTINTAQASRLLKNNDDDDKRQQRHSPSKQQIPPPIAPPTMAPTFAARQNKSRVITLSLARSQHSQLEFAEALLDVGGCGCGDAGAVVDDATHMPMLPLSTVRRTKSPGIGPSTQSTVQTRKTVNL